MNILKETKQHYFFVMIIEFIFLSCVYWYFFPFNFSSILAYLLAVFFYITGYRLWIRIFDNKKHLSLNPSEHFTTINFIVLLSVLTLNSIMTKTVYSLIFVYLSMLIIFIAYYIYKLQKQKKSPVPVSKVSPTLKVAIVLSCIFLLFDFIVYHAGKLNIQLVLYMPFLFLVLTFLLFVYTKVFEFKSFFAFILFFNIYITATIILALNSLFNNFFAVTVIFHFIIFISVLSFMSANSTLEQENFFTYGKNFISLLLLNVLLIIFSLTNILSFNFPNFFTSYVFFIAILFIAYFAVYNYKTYIN